MAAIRLLPIDDPDDPRIADYRAVRERDLVGRNGLFVAEGAVVVRTLLTTSLHAPVSLLLAENRLAGLADHLAIWPDLPVYVAAQAVMDRIVGFPIHRGVLALGRRAALPAAEALLRAAPARAIAVVLIGVTNHDNVGGVFRNAAAFGAAAVLLDPATCDPLYRKAIRVSAGAVLRVPYARLPPEVDLPGLLGASAFSPLALAPRAERRLGEVLPDARTALVVGSEGPGLPADLLNRLPSARIPMAPGTDSLNLATATGIALHHLALGGASAQAEPAFTSDIVSA